MKFCNFIAVLMLAAWLPAIADIATVVEAVETTTSNIKLPVSNNGRLSFQACAGPCEKDFVSVRLTPDTAFFVSGLAVEFDEFRTAFLNIRTGSKTYALVSYDTQSGTVTSVRIEN